MNYFRIKEHLQEYGVFFSVDLIILSFVEHVKELFLLYFQVMKAVFHLLDVFNMLIFLFIKGLTDTSIGCLHLCDFTFYNRQFYILVQNPIVD